MFKLTNSRDDVKRISTTVNYRLTLEDMATFITAKCSTDIMEHSEGNYTPNYVAIKAHLPSKITAIKIVKDTLYSDGYETPFYSVNDNAWDSTASAVKDRLEELWNI